MASIQIAKINIVRKAAFDKGDFYFSIYEFVKKRLGFSFNEDDYAEWIKGDTRDTEFHWTFEKTVDSYVKYKLWFEIKIRFAKKVKVKVGDSVKSLTDAELEFNVKSFMITDPSGKWDNLIKNYSFFKYIKDFYDKVIFKKQLDDYAARLWEITIAIEKEVKAFFDLPKFS